MYFFGPPFVLNILGPLLADLRYDVTGLRVVTNLQAHVMLS